MRYWGLNIEIDASYYNTEHGKQMSPTAAEAAQLKATGSFFQHEGNVETYEVTVQNMMRDIEANTVGRILVRALNRCSTKLRIIPLTWKEQSQLGRIPCANLVGKFSDKGNDCVVWFEPWSRMINLYGTRGNSPYQVLVHELHHALRQMRGAYYGTGPVGAFPNAEELFSVMMENMYLSAAGQPQRMLGGYNQGIPLGNRSAASFYKQYGNEIEVWCGQFKDLTYQLERMSGFWNPIGVRRMVLDFVIDLNNVQ